MDRHDEHTRQGEDVDVADGEQTNETVVEEVRDKKKKYYRIVSVIISCMLVLGVLTGFVESSWLSQCKPCVKALAGAIQNTHANDIEIILDNATQWR